MEGEYRKQTNVDWVQEVFEEKYLDLKLAQYLSVG